MTGRDRSGGFTIHFTAVHPISPARTLFLSPSADVAPSADDERQDYRGSDDPATDRAKVHWVAFVKKHYPQSELQLGLLPE
jgi:hypothetical protein